jgi:hypothetical protein
MCPEGGSREVVRSTAVAQLKMEDACSFCNVIEFFCRKKVTKIERRRPFGPSNSQWHWHNCVKTHLLAYVDIQILPLLRGEIDQHGVSCDITIIWLELHRK